jgi:acyl carrier protein
MIKIETARPETTETITRVLDSYRRNDTEEITPASNIGAMGLDSMDVIEVITDIGVELSIVVPDSDVGPLMKNRTGAILFPSGVSIKNLDHYASVRNLARYVQAQQDAQR